jgi:FkbM family methyltransferase
MILFRALPYALHWSNKYLSDIWTGRLLRHLPSAITDFHTKLTYKGITLQIYTGENTGRKIFYFGEYEPSQEEVFLAMVRDRKVFDIGANIGIFALLAASRGAKVFAFEPSRMVRAQLELNITLNGFEERVTIVPEAVSDSEGMVHFFETRDGNWGVGRIFSYGHSAGKSSDYVVPTKTLDHFISELGMPDVAKIDIEGAEWLVLKGAPNTLADRNAPDFLIEFHPEEIATLGGSMEHCIGRLLESGFTQYQLTDSLLGTSRHSWFVFSKRGLALPGLRSIR